MKNILVHVHIFKNAGSSFDDAMKQFFGDKFIDHRDDPDLIKGKMDYLLNYLDSHPKIQAFSSHSVHFLPKDTDKYKILPVYFLRHPIDRIRSVYSFEKKQTPAITIGSKKAKELNFNDYISWYMKDTSPATIRNAQIIFLSGDGPSSNNMLEKFEKAVQTINNFSLIGIVDRYDESSVVFEEYLKEFFKNIDLSYIRKNVTDTNIKATVEEKVEEILKNFDEPLKKLVKEKNRFDLELYEKSNILLDKKIKKIENFDKKLGDFKERCILKQLKQLKHQKVIEVVEDLLKTEIKNINIYLIYAESLKILKLYDKAITIYKNITEKFPNNPWAYFYLAEVYFLAGNREEANKLFNLYSEKVKDKTNILLQFSKIGFTNE